MNTALWTIAGVLAFAFAAAGLLKLTQSKTTLAASGMGWVYDFPAGTVKAIGALEILAAVGLILPAALDIVPVLVPIAAAALILMMIGAALTHARRREYPLITVNVVLAVLALCIAWGRLGNYSF
jgi:uncharacterized membrane protein YphA (DoxX/SURF4 family)